MGGGTPVRFRTGVYPLPPVLPILLILLHLQLHKEVKLSLFIVT